jgi:hypothetical protein
VLERKQNGRTETKKILRLGQTREYLAGQQMLTGKIFRALRAAKPWSDRATNDGATTDFGRRIMSRRLEYHRQGCKTL